MVEPNAGSTSSAPPPPPPPASDGSSAHLGQVLFFSAVAVLGGFLFGFDTAVINGAVGALKDNFQWTDAQVGFSVASMLIGCAIGALLSGNIADKIGRKPVMFVSAIMFLISALGSGWATGATEFILYRLLGGFAVGAASVIAPAYISEIAPARLRGRFASLQQMAIVVGISAALFSNFFINQAAGGDSSNEWLLERAAWRWMFWAEAIPCIAYLLAVAFIPESPRYLIKKGKDGRAGHVFARVAPAADVQALVRTVKESLAGAHRSNIMDLFAAGSILKPIVWVGIGVAILQQFTGINVIFYYGAVLWEATGSTEADALRNNILSGTVNMVGTVLAIMLIDKIGRKPLLAIGSVVMTVGLAVVAVVFGQAATDDGGGLILTTQQGWIALVFANVFVFGFCVTWGPVAWVLLGEMFSNRIRGAAMALASFVLWMSNFVIAQMFPIMLKGVGLSVSYWIFAAFAVISLVFTLLFIKETKGKTLEEISAGE